mgnify:CR=1 FL=1
MRFFWVFFTPLVFFGSISSDLNVALQGLQQIRTLIPERLSDQEFSISVDRYAFAESFREIPPLIHGSKIAPAKWICHSHFYYTHWTISGEPVRILDFYQEFEYGPFWLYPTAIQRLYDMHHPKDDGVE